MTKQLTGNDAEMVLDFIENRVAGNNQVPPSVRKQAEYVLENVTMANNVAAVAAAEKSPKRKERNEEKFSKEKNHSKKKVLTKEGKKGKKRYDSLRSSFSSLRSSNSGEALKNKQLASNAFILLQQRKEQPLLKHKHGWIATNGNEVPKLQGRQAIKHCVSLLPDEIYERLDNPFGMIGKTYKAHGFFPTREAVLEMNTENLWDRAFTRSVWGYFMNVAKGKREDEN